MRHAFQFRKPFNAATLRFLPQRRVIVGMLGRVRFAEVADEIWSAAIFVGSVVLLEPTARRSFEHMKMMWERAGEAGKAGWIFLWLIGVPIPVLLILFLLRGCT